MRFFTSNDPSLFPAIVDKKGLLGLFIVPISCIIVGILVAVAGVAFYQHTKGDIRVEVVLSILYSFFFTYSINAHFIIFSDL